LVLTIKFRKTAMPTKTLKVGSSTLELTQGDITEQTVDGIVNAANSALRGGGGVDGAIHRAGGPSIMEACRRIGRCDTGNAVITAAGNLRARYVIHTVGPIWQGGRAGEPELLASCYRRSLEIAAEKGLQSIAFPSVSTGVYGYPVQAAARVALAAVREFLQGSEVISLVRFVLFDAGTYEAYARAMAELETATQRSILRNHNGH